MVRGKTDIIGRDCERNKTKMEKGKMTEGQSDRDTERERDRG